MSNWQNDDAMWVPAQPQTGGTDPYSSHSRFRRKKNNSEFANGNGGGKRMIVARGRKNDSAIDTFTSRDDVAEMERQQTVATMENKEKQMQLSEANAIQKQNDYNQRKSQLFTNGSNDIDSNTAAAPAKPNNFVSKFSKSLRRVQESGSTLLNPASPHLAPASAPSPLHYKILQRPSGETSSLDTSVNLNPAPANTQTAPSSRSVSVGTNTTSSPAISSVAPTRPTRPPVGPTKPPAPTILKRPASPDSPPKPNRTVTFEASPVTVTIPSISPEAISKPDVSKRAERSWLDLDEMTSSDDDDGSESAETDYSDLGDSPLITSTQPANTTVPKASPPQHATRSRDEEVIRSPQQSKFSAAVSDLHESRSSPYNTSRQDVRSQPLLRGGRAGISSSPSSYSSGSPTHRSRYSGNSNSRYRGSPKQLSKSRRDYDRGYTDSYQSEYRTTYVVDPSSSHHSGGGGDGRAARKKKKKKNKKRSQHADYSSGGSNKGSLKRGGAPKGATQYRSKPSQRYRSTADSNYDYGGGGDTRYVRKPESSSKLSFDSSRSKRARSDPNKGGSFLDRNADYSSKDKYYDDAPVYKRTSSTGSSGGGGGGGGNKSSNNWGSKSRSRGSSRGGRGSRRETSSYYGDDYSSSSKGRKNRNRGGGGSYRERDYDY